MRTIVCWLILFVIAVPVSAQESQIPTLTPEIVEAVSLTSDRTRTEEEAREELRRTPGSVDLIGSQALKESRGANLKDVLDFVPGALIRPRFGFEESQLSIRGSGLRSNFHVRGINILLDGFLLNRADGFSDFETVVDLAFAKRIEVIKAANALRFGANSLGGAINFVNKTGYDAAPLEVGNEGGSFGFHKHYLGTGRVYGPFDLYLGLIDTELDGFRDHSEGVRRRAFSSLGYRFAGGTTVRLDLNYARTDQALPGSLTRTELERNTAQADPSYVRQDARRDHDDVRVALTVRTPLAVDQTLEWQAQYYYQRLDHPLPFAVIDDKTTNWSTELRYLRAAPLFDHGNRFTLGLQYAGTRQADANIQNRQGQRGALLTSDMNTATNVGVYAEEQFDATQTLTLVGGLRLQYSHSGDRDRFLADGDRSGTVNFFSATPKIGFVLQVAPETQLFANASRSHEPPTFFELVSPGKIGGNIRDLDAQKSWQFEIGTRGTWDKHLSWDLAFFDIELWDEIRNVNVRPFSGATFTIPRYDNIDRSRHTGVEVSTNLLVAEDLVPRMGLGNSGDAVHLRTAYTYSRFVFVHDQQFGGNDLPGAPKHFIRAEVRYDHRSGFWLAPGTEAVPTRYVVNSENTAHAKPYALFNLRIGYDYKPWGLSAFFESRNLTDAHYIASIQVDDANGRFFNPGEGRSFYGGLQWKWN